MSITIYPNQRYYTVNGQKERIKYSVKFPVDWAIYDTFVEPKLKKKNKDNQYVGSVCCANCRKYGTFRGVFVQYCKNCTVERRMGCTCMLQDIVPKEITGGRLYGYECNKADCVFKTYLKDVNLCTIGIKQEVKKKIS